MKDQNTEAQTGTAEPVASTDLLAEAVELWDICTTCAIRAVNDEWSDARIGKETERFRKRLVKIVSANAEVCDPTKEGSQHRIVSTF